MYGTCQKISISHIERPLAVDDQIDLSMLTAVTEPIDFSNSYQIAEIPLVESIRNRLKFYEFLKSIVFSFFSRSKSPKIVSQIKNSQKFKLKKSQNPSKKSLNSLALKECGFVAKIIFEPK